MDLLLIYIFYIVYDYMYFEGLIYVYLELKKSLFYIVGKILFMLVYVYILIDRFLKKDDILFCIRISF